MPLNDTNQLKSKIMENKELIELAIKWFKDVEDKTKTLTTGNVSHNSRSIQGFAHRCAEFLEKHKK